MVKKLSPQYPLERGTAAALWNRFKEYKAVDVSVELKELSSYEAGWRFEGEVGSQACPQVARAQFEAAAGFGYRKPPRKGAGLKADEINSYTEVDLISNTKPYKYKLFISTKARHFVQASALMGTEDSFAESIKLNPETEGIIKTLWEDLSKGAVGGKQRGPKNPEQNKREFSILRCIATYCHFKVGEKWEIAVYSVVMIAWPVLMGTVEAKTILGMASLGPRVTYGKQIVSIHVQMDANGKFQMFIETTLAHNADWSK
ncbi:hypothetical protein ABW19_dt0202117 [Dactylella cylindrospora]|nr:hypothetical protein ABW19_dt0202117 [Dactylella cylindrospora]